MRNNVTNRSSKYTLLQHLWQNAQRPARGQALIEYALITVLLVLAVIVAMLATGPAVGNIFSNTVFNLIGAPQPSITPLNPTEFWQLVTAVASYTPQSVILPTNTSAAPTSTPTTGPSPTHTPLTPTATPSNTSTPGPSPTPPDIMHRAPFLDNVSNPNWWRLGSDSIFTGFEPWTVEWWSTNSGTRNIAHVESRMAAAPTCTSTYDQPNLSFYWGTGGPTPGGTCSGNPWRTDDFATRWTRTIYFQNTTTVNLTVISDDGLRVKIDGTLVPGLGSWSYHGEQTNTVPYTFSGGTNHTIVVEYFEGNGSATMVFKMSAQTDNQGICNWAMSSEAAHSSPDAWSDSPGGYDYANNSRCYLALRGAVDVSPVSSPRMTFWDRWSLNNYDIAWLEIREYAGANNTGPWFAVKVHENFSEQLSWNRQAFDLTAYTAMNTQTMATSTIDWRGKTIEFRFMLEADAANTRNGWWIDDIAIDQNELRTYTVGFFDNFESGDANWLPGGSWAITAERTRSGTGAYSDSPGGNYPALTNASLELNGMIDLTASAGVTIDNPELVFYHAWNLGSGDSIFVEVSADRSTWTSLTPARPAGALQTATRNDAFVREALSLNGYTDKPYYLRFRINANNSDQKDGWYIDDVAIENHPTGYMPYPFFDNMDGGASNWLPEGEWALSPEAAYSGSVAWSDSPGKNYTHNTNSSLQVALPFLLTTAQATRPELSFWYRRHLTNVEKFHVEVSQNNGASWTSIWSFQYDASTTAPAESPGTPRSAFNRQLGWEYVSINMTPYISDTTPFLLRFRLDALTDYSVADGVWIDDVRLGEYVETPHSFPFYDDMEGTTNWRLGNIWAVSNEAAHSGSYALNDSPGVNYAPYTYSIVELKNPINMTGVTASSAFPVLTWWDRFRLGTSDFMRVQVSTWNGGSWSNWSPWTQVFQHTYNNDTMSWTFRRVDLRPYKGKMIRIRFVVDGLQDTNTDPGWWIDDVAVELYQPPVFAQPYTNTADTTTHFITDGTWGLGEVFYGSGSGPAVLGPGVWQGYFYDLNEWQCGSISTRADKALSNADSACAGIQYYTSYGPYGIANINYVCDSLSSPHPSGVCSAVSWKPFNNYDHDNMAIRFERTIMVSDGTYQFRVTHDDGARLYITDLSSGTRIRILDAWYDTGPRTDTVSRTLTTGSYKLELWFYEASGGCTIQLDVLRQSFSFDDSPGTNYSYLDNSSLTFKGVVNMTGTTTPALSWQQQYDADASSGACMIAEVMLPYEPNRFEQWIEVYRRCDAKDTTWTQALAPLRGPIETALGRAINFNGLLLTFRFRLDARFTSYTDVGWTIDDIIIAD